MAVQVIHSGREAYENVSFGTNLGAVLDDVFTFKTKLDEKYYEIKRAEEMWAIGMMDVDAAGMTLSKFQEKAKDGIDEYVNIVSEMYKNKEVLSTEEKIEIANRRTRLKTQIEEFKAKNIQFNNILKQVEMHPQYYDYEETQAAFKEFIEDPINRPVPMPVPAYVDIVHTMVAQLNRSNPITTIQKGQNLIRIRTGVESKEDKNNVVSGIILSSKDLQRSIMHEMGKINYETKEKVPTIEEMTEYVMDEYQSVLFPDMEGHKISGMGGSRRNQPVLLPSNDEKYHIGVDLKMPTLVSIGKGTKLYSELNDKDLVPEKPKLKTVSVYSDRVELTFDIYAEISIHSTATSIAVPNYSGQKETPVGDGEVMTTTKNDKTISIKWDDDQGIDEVKKLLETMLNRFEDNDPIKRTYNIFIDLYNKRKKEEIDYNVIKNTEQ